MSVEDNEHPEVEVVTQEENLEAQPVEMISEPAKVMRIGSRS